MNNSTVIEIFIQNHPQIRDDLGRMPVSFFIMRFSLQFSIAMQTDKLVCTTKEDRQSYFCQHRYVQTNTTMSFTSLTFVIQPF